jgi:hypothetical protein
MELLERITHSLTAKGRLLKELAAISGRMQGLADRLERHGQACVYPQMKSKIEDVEAGIKAQTKVLTGILSDNRVWARLPERAGHEGINNWERLSNDLISLGKINVDLNQQSVRWMPVDADIAERLRALVNEQVPLIDGLQEVAARSDPQAID